VAELALPILPEYLYRYRPLTGPDDKAVPDTVFDREVAAIIEPYIWCGEFNDLNDPMEGFFAPTRRLNVHSRRQDIVDAIVQGKSGVGIASLSETNYNELMWTHYADNSTGICIEYRPRTLLANLPCSTTLVRVGYDDKPAYVGVRDFKNQQLAVKKVLSQKKFNWAYEREWRLLSSLGQISITSKKVIRRIYVGSRISEYHKFKLHNGLTGTLIKLYEMEVDGYSYTYSKHVPSLRSPSQP
jgi:hypothetical protein